MVDWDQRGSGRSFHGNETSATLSIDVLVADGLALVDRLRAEVPGRPIVLAGHSFGTVLGVMMANRAPDRIDAYVGASQVVNWALQEGRSYQWALAQAERSGNEKAIAALRGIGQPDSGIYSGGRASVEVQRRWLGALGGVSGDPRFLTRWTMTILLARDYPLGAKLRFTKGLARSMDLIWPELGERIDFQRDISLLQVPVHIFAGDSGSDHRPGSDSRLARRPRGTDQTTRGGGGCRTPQSVRGSAAFCRIHVSGAGDGGGLEAARGVERGTEGILNP